MANINSNDDALDMPAEAIEDATSDLNENVPNKDEQREIKLDKTKQVIKLTPKALCEKIEKLQAIRKAKLNKASNLKKVVEELMSEKDCKSEVKCAFSKFVVVWDEVKSLHDSLMGLLPGDELERQQTWFKAKMLINNDFINDLQKWLTQTFNNDDKNRSSQVENDKNENEVIDDDVLPEDSVSNVASKLSSKLSAGSRKSSSSTASLRIKAEAERAALVARAAALKGKHLLEEQEQQLRRKREQLELEAEIAATTAN